MRNSKKLLLHTLLAATMTIGMSSVVHAAPSNSCGETAVWSYNSSNKTLTINGSGHITANYKWDDLDIEHIDIKDGITRITSYTFSGMDTLDSVSIPDSVTRIGSYAFSSTGLDKVTLPDTIKKLGSGIFSNCEELTTVNWSTDTIPSDTFYYCKKLETINLKKQITSIERSAFEGCKSLNKVPKSDSLEKIGAYAFARTGIKKYIMPDTVKNLGSGAFSNCKKLKKLTISGGIDSVPSSIVDSSKKLKTLVIKEGPTKINGDAFYSSKIKELKLPDSITSIAGSGFRCADIETVVIPKNVKTIGEYAFSFSTIKSLSLPDGVTYIGKYAFNHMENLKSLELPDELPELVDYTFANCTGLENITFGSKLITIGECAFEGCSNLKDVVIPGNVITIGYGAFQSSGCETITIQDGVNEIDYWAFNNCDNLVAVTIGDSVTVVAENAFSNCDKLTNINVSTSNAYYSTAEGCLLDKSGKLLITVPAGKSGAFQMPASVRDVDPAAFYGCNKITSILSDNTNYFKTVDGVLYNSSLNTLVCCPSSKTGTITIPSTVLVIKESAFQNSKASDIILPDSLVSIGHCAFEDCDNLKSIRIPGSVKKITSAAFWGCDKLTTVKIERGVKYIRRSAFKDCTNLKKITIPTSVTKIAKTAFNNCDCVTFYCKKSSYAMAYANKRVNRNITYRII